MTAETECCEACRPVELAGPYRYKHGWVRIADLREGDHIRHDNRVYRVKSVGPAKSARPEDPAYRDVHLQMPGMDVHRTEAMHQEDQVQKLDSAQVERVAARARARDRAENRRAYTARQRGLGPPGTAPRPNRVQWGNQGYPGPTTTWANAPPLEPPKA